MTDSAADRPLTEGYLSSAVQRTHFGAHATLQALLSFESNLAWAEADCGVIPLAAAEQIALACHADYYSSEELRRATALAGNVAIPLVTALTARVEQADPHAAGFVHWGATSQDAIDTAFALQVRGALRDIDLPLAACLRRLTRLTRDHRDTLMVARTLGQQALPTTFGYKTAGWLRALAGPRRHLQALRVGLPLQFGGAAGTLASLGAKGPDVATALARRLDLEVCVPWHGDRSVVRRIALELGLLAAACGKLATDLLALMQSEVAELAEGAPGGSSTLPQKRNPVATVAVAAAARRAPGLVATLLAAFDHQHERAAGAWQAEWETLSELCAVVGAAVEQLARALDGLAVDASRMRRNLDAGGGLVMAEAVAMALALHLGRDAAQQVIRTAADAAVAGGRGLREVLGEASEVTALFAPPELDGLFDPAHYLGASASFVDQILAVDGHE